MLTGLLGRRVEGAEGAPGEEVGCPPVASDEGAGAAAERRGRVGPRWGVMGKTLNRAGRVGAAVLGPCGP